MEDILNKRVVTKEEMTRYYESTHPYIGNHRRVGDFAKKMGFEPRRQMVNGKYNRFYLNMNYQTNQ